MQKTNMQRNMVNNFPYLVKTINSQIQKCRKAQSAHHNKTAENQK